MGITWKDGITTALSLLTAGMFYARTQGMDLPLIDSNRLSTALLAVLGIGMCALGAGVVGKKGPMMIMLSGLGILAFLLIVTGLVTGNAVIVSLLTVTILALWFLSTARHALGGK